MLQTRSGKRTGYAAVVIATDFVKEKLVTPKEAILLVDPEALSQLLAPGFDPKEWKAHETVTKGLPASPGAACGKAVFSSETAVEWSNKGEPVILVRRETVPDDIHGMWVSQGILTATGGMTSHAAVVGRQMGKPSIVGAGELRIDEHGKTLHREGQDRQGRRLRRVRRPHRRSEARQGGVAAERDPAGGGRQDEAGGLADLSALQHAARVDRQVPPPRRARQCRSARSGRARLRVRRPRHRPLPHRAHVLRRRPHPDRAAHDPRRQRSRSPRRAERAAADAARGLLRRVQGHEGRRR